MRSVPISSSQSVGWWFNAITLSSWAAFRLACTAVRKRHTASSWRLVRRLTSPRLLLAKIGDKKYKIISIRHRLTTVLGQLPMRTIPHQIKIKPNHYPPGPQIPRTIPHQDNSPLGPLPQNKTTLQDQNLCGGELLSSWGVVRIQLTTYTPNPNYLIAIQLGHCATPKIKIKILNECHRLYHHGIEFSIMYTYTYKQTFYYIVLHNYYISFFSSSPPFLSFLFRACYLHD